MSQQYAPELIEWLELFIEENGLVESNWNRLLDLVKQQDGEFERLRKENKALLLEIRRNCENCANWRPRQKPACKVGGCEHLLTRWPENWQWRGPEGRDSG